MPQLRAQNLREQRVVAEPGAAGVERVHEAIDPLELAQECSPAGTPARAREFAVEPVDDRGAQQELQRLLVVAADDLGHQVVADRAVVTRKGCDEPARVGMIPKRELREPEPGGPALRARPERLDVIRWKRERTRSSHASEGVNASSAVRISVIWPATRRR